MESIHSHHNQRNKIDIIYQHAAIEVIKSSFANSKNIASILQSLVANIETKFLGTREQTHLPYHDHVQQFITAILREALNRYSGSRTKFSVAQEYTWGQSNTLSVLGVLKNVATELNIQLPSEVETPLNTALSYLHFYSSKLDMRGARGFDVASGTFATLSSSYSQYNECVTYVSILVGIIKDLQHPNTSSYKEVEEFLDLAKPQPDTNNNNSGGETRDSEKENISNKNIPSPFLEKGPPLEEENTLPHKNAPFPYMQENIPPQEEGHKLNTNSPISLEEKTQVDWDTIDNNFQKGIIKLAQRYKLQAFYAPQQTWVTGANIIKFCTKKSRPISNPERYRELTPIYHKISEHAPLPPGKYAINTTCPPWMQTPPTPSKPGNRGQGLKLHVSAKPETALKVAQIAIPLLDANHIAYKVMYDLPLMRGLYYLSQYGREDFLIGTNQSTQAGKFIAIYPNSLDEAQSIISILETAFQTSGLQPSDFVKLAGDAQIGDSGGIFGRYGKFSNVSHKGRLPSHITPIDVLDKSLPPHVLAQENIPYDPRIGMADERIYPWPDFMNNRNLYPGALFGNLNVKWVNPYNPEQVITWENRPKCWAELKGKSCPKGQNNQIE